MLSVVVVVFLKSSFLLFKFIFCYGVYICLLSLFFVCCLLCACVSYWNVQVLFQNSTWIALKNLKGPIFSESIIKKKRQLSTVFYVMLGNKHTFVLPFPILLSSMFYLFNLGFQTQIVLSPTPAQCLVCKHTEKLRGCYMNTHIPNIQFPPLPSYFV